MVRIVDQARVAIHEDALRLREGHAVLGKVASRFFRIPRKENFAHSNSLAIMRLSFVLDFIGSHGEWCRILTRLTIRAKPLATVALLAPRTIPSSASSFGFGAARNLSRFLKFGREIWVAKRCFAESVQPRAESDCAVVQRRWAGCFGVHFPQPRPHFPHQIKEPPPPTLNW